MSFFKGFSELWRDTGQRIHVDLSKKGPINVNRLARLIWQELFNVYRAQGGNLNDVHDLLCDLATIRDNAQLLKSWRFFWAFDTDGMTDLVCEAQYMSSACDWLCCIDYDCEKNLFSVRVFESVFHHDRVTGDIWDLPAGTYVTSPDQTTGLTIIVDTMACGTRAVGIMDNKAILRAEF